MWNGSPAVSFWPSKHKLVPIMRLYMYCFLIKVIITNKQNYDQTILTARQFNDARNN
jgi:hypothetical protein